MRNFRTNGKVIKKRYDDPHLRFDGIPADLTGKRVKIECKLDDKKIQIFLSNNNRLNVVETLDGKETSFEIQKVGESWKGSVSWGPEDATSGWEGEPMKDKDTKKLISLIDFVIKNPDNFVKM